MSIKMGKYYKTRNNRRVQILTTDRKHVYPVVGIIDYNDVDELHSWSPAGNYFSNGTKHELDIVGEFVLPAVDWAVLPTQARWIAQDRNKGWHWFKEKPRKNRRNWRSNSCCGEIFPVPAYNESWEDSLVKRPAESD